MRAGILIILGMPLLLTGCISGKPDSDTYTDRSGQTTVIQTDAEQCRSSCNSVYSRCMDTTDARSNGGVNGPKGMFGASGDCRSDLQSCLPSCKGE